MTIPEIRARLHVLAVELDIPELAELAEATRRRQHGRVSARQRSLVGPLAMRIRGYAALHPAATMFEIGGHFNVNQGRVSEALYGVRE